MTEQVEKPKVSNLNKNGLTKGKLLTAQELAEYKAKKRQKRK